jgi:hypothetical protein
MSGGLRGSDRRNDKNTLCVCASTSAAAFITGAGVLATSNRGAAFNAVLGSSSNLNSTADGSNVI